MTVRKKITAWLLCLLFVLFAAPAWADYTYTNPETGYKAVIQDELQLLTDAEAKALMQCMIPLTEKTNAAYCTSEKASTQTEAIKNAENKHIELFGHFVNGVVFMVDMNARYMFLDTEGWIQEKIPKSTAETITNNIRSEMTAGNYYSAAVTLFEQVSARSLDEKIPEPMRYLSSAVIALMLALLIMLLLTVILRRKVLPAGYLPGTTAEIMLTAGLTEALLGALKATGEPDISREYKPRSSGGSSCSSCSSGSSCSSCSGGSSCSSCGGGSSF